MTRISAIRGFDKKEAKQRAKGLKKARFVNYTAMTDGELRLALLSEQFNILEGFYPENQDYKKGRLFLENAIANQVHVAGKQQITGLPDRLRFLYAEVAKAKMKNRPAATYIVSRNKIGDLIPQEDCRKILTSGVPTFSEKGSGEKSQMERYIKCVEQNNQKKILNEHLEKSAHHLLYEYLKNPNAVPGVVSAKFIGHQNAISALAEITKISRENIRLWVRNGVMRTNASKGIDPFQPEFTISIMAEEIPEKHSSINGPFLAALPVIISAIAGAVSATTALIGAMKQKSQQDYIKTVAQGIATPTFGPQEKDWFGNPIPNNTSTPGSTVPVSAASNLLSNNMLILGALGLVGLTLLE